MRVTLFVFTLIPFILAQIVQDGDNNMIINSPFGVDILSPVNIVSRNGQLLYPNIVAQANREKEKLQQLQHLAITKLLDTEPTSVMTGTSIGAASTLDVGTEEHLIILSRNAGTNQPAAYVWNSTQQAFEKKYDIGPELNSTTVPLRARATFKINDVPWVFYHYRDSIQLSNWNGTGYSTPFARTSIQTVTVYCRLNGTPFEHSIVHSSSSSIGILSYNVNNGSWTEHTTQASSVSQSPAGLNYFQFGNSHYIARSASSARKIDIYRLVNNSGSWLWNLTATISTPRQPERMITFISGNNVYLIAPYLSSPTTTLLATVYKWNGDVPSNWVSLQNFTLSIQCSILPATPPYVVYMKPYFYMSLPFVGGGGDSTRPTGVNLYMFNHNIDHFELISSNTTIGDLGIYTFFRYDSKNWVVHSSSESIPATNSLWKLSP